MFTYLIKQELGAAFFAASICAAKFLGSKYEKLNINIEGEYRKLAISALVIYQIFQLVDRGVTYTTSKIKSLKNYEVNIKIILSGTIGWVATSFDSKGFLPQQYRVPFLALCTLGFLPSWIDPKPENNVKELLDEAKITQNNAGTHVLNNLRNELSTMITNAQQDQNNATDFAIKKLETKLMSIIGTKNDEVSEQIAGMLKTVNTCKEMIQEINKKINDEISENYLDNKNEINNLGIELGEVYQKISILSKTIGIDLDKFTDVQDNINIVDQQKNNIVESLNSINETLQNLKYRIEFLENTDSEQDFVDEHNNSQSDIEDDAKNSDPILSQNPTPEIQVKDDLSEKEPIDLQEPMSDISNWDAEDKNLQNSQRSKDIRYTNDNQSSEQNIENKLDHKAQGKTEEKQENDKGFTFQYQPFSFPKYDNSQNQQHSPPNEKEFRPNPSKENLDSSQTEDNNNLNDFKNSKELILDRTTVNDNDKDIPILTFESSLPTDSPTSNITKLILSNKGTPVNSPTKLSPRDLTENVNSDLADL